MDGNDCVPLFVEKCGSLIIFRIPPGMRKTPLTDLNFLTIGKKGSISKKHIPDSDVSRVLCRLNAAAESPFNVFPLALVFQKGEPEIEKIMELIGDLFPGKKVVLVEKEFKFPSCTCAKCTRCGDCDVALSF